LLCLLLTASPTSRGLTACPTFHGARSAWHCDRHLLAAARRPGSSLARVECRRPSLRVRRTACVSPRLDGEHRHRQRVPYRRRSSWLALCQHPAPAADLEAARGRGPPRESAHLGAASHRPVVVRECAASRPKMARVVHGNDRGHHARHGRRDWAHAALAFAGKTRHRPGVHVARTEKSQRQQESNERLRDHSWFIGLRPRRSAAHRARECWRRTAGRARRPAPIARTVLDAFCSARTALKPQNDLRDVQLRPHARAHAHRSCAGAPRRLKIAGPLMVGLGPYPVPTGSSCCTSAFRPEHPTRVRTALRLLLGTIAMLVLAA